MSTRLRIAVLEGGWSPERHISQQSAENVLALLRTVDTYEVYRITVNKDNWLLHTSNQTVPVHRDDFSATVHGAILRFDIAVIVIHGTPGEDGKLQSYFDIIGLPYLSCSASVSMLTANKYCASLVARAGGANVAASVLVHKGECPQSVAKRVAHMGLPLFVKPNSGGSSLGMSKIHCLDELTQALREAFANDELVLIEQCIRGREFTAGAYALGGHITVLPCTEIVVEERSFFDHEAKYSGKTKEITPAHITEDIRDNIEQTVQLLYRHFGCTGIVRFDFIYDTTAAKLYFLEVNTIPGQTKQSLIPQQIHASGQSLADIYTQLIDEIRKR